MATKKQLGLYFGDTTISIVETNNQVPEKFATAQHSLLDISGSKQEGQEENPDEIKLAAVIQKTLRDQNILETKDVGLSLPAKDVIFRSFVLPAMQPSEIKGVIEFEARKYIPFKLDQLSYTYHYIPFTENNTKRVRILFTAIKKETLQKYVKILEECDLKVTFIEPAPMSFIRALMLRNQIPKNQRIAIISASDRIGRITIIENCIPHFVRDFQFVPPTVEDAEIDPEIINAKLFNEIRNSLTYYSRQSGEKKIDGIITLSIDKTSEVLESLTKEMGTPTISLSAQTILGVSTPVDIDLLNAFGIGLRNNVQTPATFDLTRKEERALPFAKKALDVSLLAKTGVACVAVLALTFFLSGRISTDYKNKLTLLNKELGKYEGVTLEKIEEESAQVKEKLAAYKEVPLRSNVAQFLTLVPNLLPDEAWLENFKVNYAYSTESVRRKKNNPTVQRVITAVSMHLAGYVFDEDVNQQIQILNQLVTNLKADKELSTAFNSIDLISAETQNFGGYLVTRFKISCE